MEYNEGIIQQALVHPTLAAQLPGIILEGELQDSNEADPVEADSIIISEADNAALAAANANLEPADVQHELTGVKTHALGYELEYAESSDDEESDDELIDHL